MIYSMYSVQKRSAGMLISLAAMSESVPSSPGFLSFRFPVTQGNPSSLARTLTSRTRQDAQADGDRGASGKASDRPGRHVRKEGGGCRAWPPPAACVGPTLWAKSISGGFIHSPFISCTTLQVSRRLILGKPKI